MRIPEKIKIGGITYDVFVSEKILSLEGKICSGIIHYEDAQIELNNGRSEQKIQETLWHEIIHGMSRDRGFNWGENDELYTEELGKSMNAFIKDNPELFKDGGQNG